ncbi:hypothetical protein Tco_0364068 [Tanacetum coccineum]
MLTTTFLTWLFIPVLLICMLNVETYIEAAKIVVKQGHAPDDITFVARAGLFEAAMDMINNMEVNSWSFGVGASTAHTWTTLSSSGADDVCVMTSESMDDPGKPPGIVLSAATSFWIPIQPKQIFIFLWDENFTSEISSWRIVGKNACMSWNDKKPFTIKELDDIVSSVLRLINHSQEKELPAVYAESFESLPGRGLYATSSGLEKITEAVIKSSHGTDLVRAALSVNNKKLRVHTNVPNNLAVALNLVPKSLAAALYLASVCAAGDGSAYQWSTILGDDVVVVAESNWGVKRDAGRCVAIICSVGRSIVCVELVMMMERGWWITFECKCVEDIQNARGIEDDELRSCYFVYIDLRLCLAGMLLIDLFISISSDLSEDSVGTPTRRVILFGTIPTTIPDTTPVITLPATKTVTQVIPTETPIITPTIPPSPDYTPASLDYSPASDSKSDPSEDSSSDHIPPLPDILPFLSSDDDPTDSDTPDTPSSPTHDTTYSQRFSFST